MTSGLTTELRHWRDFLWQAAANYRETGAFAPSSRFLARMIVRQTNLLAGHDVLEIGAGTGVFTAELLRQLPAGSRLLVLEKSPLFATVLRRRFPGIPILETCASRLGEGLQQHSLAAVDRVVSGLPWASMPPDLQKLLLKEIRTRLHPGGIFTTFAYFGPHLLPAGRGFRLRLEREFVSVERTRIELRNLPPAFVYRAMVQG